MGPDPSTGTLAMLKVDNWTQKLGLLIAIVLNLLTVPLIRLVPLQENDPKYWQVRPLCLDDLTQTGQFAGHYIDET